MSGAPTVAAAVDAKVREGATPRPNSPSKTLRQLSVKQRAVKESLFVSLETAMVVPLMLIVVFVTTRYISSVTLFRLPSESFTSSRTMTPT